MYRSTFLVKVLGAGKVPNVVENYVLSFKQLNVCATQYHTIIYKGKFVIRSLAV